VLRSHADGFASDSGVANTVQLASEQASNAASGAIDGAEEIRTAFFHVHTAERQYFSTDSAAGLGATGCAQLHGDFSHSAPEAGQSKPEPPFYIRPDGIAKISIAGVHGNLH
jgi:hypothetical protein